MIVRLGEGFIVPRFYGVAWTDYMRRQAICLPIPLNVIAGYARGVWFWLKYDYRPPNSSACDAYAQGFRHGRKAVESVRVQPD